MGIFSRSRPAPAPAVDIDRMRALFANQGGVVTPLGDQLPDVAAAAGVRPQDLDPVLVLQTLYTCFANVVRYAAGTVGVPAVAERVDAYFAAPDFEESGLWDTMFRAGPKGVAVALFVSTQSQDGILSAATATKLQEDGRLGTAYEQVPDPCLGQDDPKQAAFRLMDSLGVYTVVHGPGTPDELVDAVLDASPRLRSSEARGDSAFFGGSALWSVWTDGTQSALTFFYTWNDDDQRDAVFTVVEELGTVGAPWRTANGRKGALVPADVVAVLRDGEHVPASTLRALGADADGVDHAADRDRLLALVTDAGFEQIGDGIHRGVLPTADDRTQIVFVTLDSRLRLLSPIAEWAEEEPPAGVSETDFGRYAVEAIPPLLLLRLDLPWTTSDDDVRDEALALARYADQWEDVLTPGSDAL